MNQQISQQKTASSIDDCLTNVVSNNKDQYCIQLSPQQNSCQAEGSSEGKMQSNKLFEEEKIKEIQTFQSINNEISDSNDKQFHRKEFFSSSLKQVRPSRLPPLTSLMPSSPSNMHIFRQNSKIFQIDSSNIQSYDRSSQIQKIDQLLQNQQTAAEDEEKQQGIFSFSFNEDFQSVRHIENDSLDQNQREINNEQIIEKITTNILNNMIIQEIQNEKQIKIEMQNLIYPQQSQIKNMKEIEVGESEQYSSQFSQANTENQIQENKSSLQNDESSTMSQLPSTSHVLQTPSRVQIHFHQNQEQNGQCKNPHFNLSSSSSINQFSIQNQQNQIQSDYLFTDTQLQNLNNQEIRLDSTRSVDKYQGSEFESEDQNTQSLQFNIRNLNNSLQLINNTHINNSDDQFAQYAQRVGQRERANSSYIHQRLDSNHVYNTFNQQSEPRNLTISSLIELFQTNREQQQRERQISQSISYNRSLSNQSQIIEFQQFSSNLNTVNNISEFQGFAQNNRIQVLDSQVAQVQTSSPITLNIQNRNEQNSRREYNFNRGSFSRAAGYNARNRMSALSQNEQFISRNRIQSQNSHSNPLLIIENQQSDQEAQLRTQQEQIQNYFHQRSAGLFPLPLRANLVEQIYPQLTENRIEEEKDSNIEDEAQRLENLSQIDILIQRSGQHSRRDTIIENSQINFTEEHPVYNSVQSQFSIQNQENQDQQANEQIYAEEIDLDAEEHFLSQGINNAPIYITSNLQPNNSFNSILQRRRLHQQRNLRFQRRITGLTVNVTNNDSISNAEQDQQIEEFRNQFTQLMQNEYSAGESNDSSVSLERSFYIRNVSTLENDQARPFQSLQQNRYYPGIQVRDLRIGAGFYPQEVVLRSSEDDVHSLNRHSDFDEESHFDSVISYSRNNQMHRESDYTNQIRRNYINITQNRDSRGSFRINTDNSYGSVPKRSKRELDEIYFSMYNKIPYQWKLEELSRDQVTKEVNYVSYIQNYGPLALLIYFRSQNLVNSSLSQKQKSFNRLSLIKREKDKKITNLTKDFDIDQADMQTLKFLPINSDYIKFLQRLLIFYSYNFKQCLNINATQFSVNCNQKHEKIKIPLSQQNIHKGDPELAKTANLRLIALFQKIIPQCKQLQNILKDKRKNNKNNKAKKSQDQHKINIFEDQNVVYIVIMKLLESYLSEFNLGGKEKKKQGQSYIEDFIPLAIEFYKYHVDSSDFVLVNSLIRYLNIYLPNLQSSRFLVTKEQYLKYFEGEKLKWRSIILQQKSLKKQCFNQQKQDITMNQWI